LLRAATAAGYESLGWPGGGAIRRGALADLVAIDTETVRLAGIPKENLVDGVVFAGGAADVRDVIVAGEFVVRDRSHQRLDVPRALADSITA
jgi:cytosine/adenosine deaminase-related metal-dependent hydrolase